MGRGGCGAGGMRAEGNCLYQDFRDFKISDESFMYHLENPLIQYILIKTIPCFFPDSYEAIAIFQKSAIRSGCAYRYFGVF